MQPKLAYSILIRVAILLAMSLLIGGRVVYAQQFQVSLKDYATGFCLDSNTKRQVYTLKCNDGNFQDWIVTYNKEDKTVTLKNDATGFCLDSNTKRQVYTLKCNGGAFQRWYLRGASSGSTLKNLATGFCLDSNAKRNVYTLKCNGGDYQSWLSH